MPRGSSPYRQYPALSAGLRVQPGPRRQAGSPTSGASKSSRRVGVSGGSARMRGNELITAPRPDPRLHRRNVEATRDRAGRGPGRKHGRAANHSRRPGRGAGVPGRPDQPDAGAARRNRGQFRGSCQCIGRLTAADLCAACRRSMIRIHRLPGGARPLVRIDGPRRIAEGKVKELKSMKKLPGPTRSDGRPHGPMTAAWILVSFSASSRPPGRKAWTRPWRRPIPENPTLLAARAELRGVNERVPQELSNYRPERVCRRSGWNRTDRLGFRRRQQSVLGDGADNQRTLGSPAGCRTAALSGRSHGQPASRGPRPRFRRNGRGLHSRSSRMSCWRRFTAYMDVWRDEAVLQLNINNEKVLASASSRRPRTGSTWAS